ncbi:hypothetical protein IGL98_000953 [Enterococcus sp. DIV0840]|uniref:hypothetical protein n=1 Tax=unclassified Enterococcus TaxID=2608891 RepID=UPI001A8E4EA6|nr:hypothetical protein [Enterococcus sp. DIV0849a]MBO0433649.1 hypothetical protein [Enterococcus sp. DIV0849a]
MNTINIDQIKQEIKDIVVPEIIHEFEWLNAREAGFYEMYETDDEVLRMKKNLYHRFVDGAIPIVESSGIKERYQALIKLSLRKRVNNLASKRGV